MSNHRRKVLILVYINLHWSDRNSTVAEPKDIETEQYLQMTVQFNINMSALLGGGRVHR